ncbi:ribonuclease H-like domain-containing protein [Tanacetum coccineum]
MIAVAAMEYQLGGAVDWRLPADNETEVYNVWAIRTRFPEGGSAEARTQLIRPHWHQTSLDHRRNYLEIVSRLRGALKIVTLKDPRFGERKSQYLDDIVVLTGGTVIRHEVGLTLPLRFQQSSVAYSRWDQHKEPQLAALKRISRYVQGTLDLGLHLYASSTTSLVGYTDANWAGYPSTHSAKAEYRGIANSVAETVWIHNLLCELHSPLLTVTLAYYDNVSAVYMSANPVQHQRTKHIEIDIHFV